MGKMKDKFLEDQEKALNDAIDAFMDDDYQLEEYYTSLKPEDCCGNDCHCTGEPATQEDVQSNHDDWWNSLTNEQKQKLYNDQEEAEQDRIDNDINGLNSQYGV